MIDLRATHDRVLLVRVHQRSEHIVHAFEIMGVTDSVLQLGEVVGLGPWWTSGKYERYGLKKGDLVVYPSPRIFDHFEYTFTDGPMKGTQKVLVVPGAWIGAVVRDGFLANNPDKREYGRPLE